MTNTDRINYCRKALLDPTISPARRLMLGTRLLQMAGVGHCARCGRTLTDPTSLARGLGPECAAV